MELKIYEQPNSEEGTSAYFFALPESLCGSIPVMRTVKVPAGSVWTKRGAENVLLTPDGVHHTAADVLKSAAMSQDGFAVVD